MLSPDQIVAKMRENDAFSQWLGIEVISLSLGSCVLQMQVNEHMLNGFHIAHGGISYALADSALAFASNTYGFQSVSIETAISHAKPVFLNDVLRAECTEINRGKTIGLYQVSVRNQAGKLIAHFKGTVHISDKIWE